MSALLARFARILPYFRQSRSALLVAALATLLAAATEPAIPALLQPLLDKGFTGGALPLWMVPVAIVGIFAIRGVAGFVAAYALSWAAHRGVLALRQAMFARVLDAQPAMFARESASSLTNTLVYEVQSGAQMLVGAVLNGTKDLLALVALLGYLLWLNWQLTLFVGVLFPAVAWVMRTAGKRVHRLTVEGQQATDALGYVVEENVLAWRIVRLHGAEAGQAGRFEHHAQLLRRIFMKTVAATSVMNPLTQLITALALSAVITLALYQSQTGAATVGSFAAFITAMLMLVTPIKHLSDVMGPITRGLAAVERGLALLDDSPPEAGGGHRTDRAQGAITLEGVRLRYRDDQPPALDGLDLQVAAGETVALVGPSGAGKSSLINLLPRFVQPTGGRITLDGVPLAQWDLATLRRQFALVSQDVVLFNDSVAANIALGDAVPDRARVQQALESAQLADFVAGLPQGIDTVIGHNGGTLSGGQRQRLAIARALYKNAPVLILDEATSALDTESERGVQAALEVLMRGRTTLIIAHRLSTIEHADRIAVMEAGRVVEAGPHAALLAQGGLYARLHAMQFRNAA